MLVNTDHLSEKFGSGAGGQYCSHREKLHEGDTHLTTHSGRRAHRRNSLISLCDEFNLRSERYTTQHVVAAHQ